MQTGEKQLHMHKDDVLILLYETNQGRMCIFSTCRRRRVSSAASAEWTAEKSLSSHRSNWIQQIINWIISSQKTYCITSAHQPSKSSSVSKLWYLGNLSLGAESAENAVVQLQAQRFSHRSLTITLPFFTKSSSIYNDHLYCSDTKWHHARRSCVFS